MRSYPKPKPPSGPIGLSPLTLALILLVGALIAVAIWAALHQRPAAPAHLPPGALPDRALTPGAINPAVTDATICAHDWGAGAGAGDPPREDGDLTYSKAARHTSAGIKDAVFAEYNVVNPRDRGHSWEIDHLVPLSLGGMDVRENLWPESRTADGWNAWVKDRLEYRLYRMVCDPPPGAARLPLRQAQDAIRTDWVAAYHTYCADQADCPAFGGE